MSQKQLARLRIKLVLAISLGMVILLAWEFFHGGVAVHHLLHRADMPGISNWWGLVLLPALAWFLTGRTLERITRAARRKMTTSKLPADVLIGFLAALVFGGLLSFLFASGQNDITGYLFQAMLLIAVLLPVYRAECVLGFVLGMTITFGAVIPTIVGTVVAAGSAFVHLLLWPFLRRLWVWSRKR